MRGGGPQDISEKPVDRGKPLKEPQGSFMTQPTGLTFTSWHPNTSFFKLTLRNRSLGQFPPLPEEDLGQRSRATHAGSITQS